MLYGISFSHTHIRSFGIDPLDALNASLEFPFSWIRLGCYWNEIEQSPGAYDFSCLDPLVSWCQKNKKNVVLTVGMKAPRWPEYYIPKWADTTTIPNNAILDPSDYRTLHASAIRFVSACVSHFKKAKIIRVWQVENEPYDPSGPHSWALSSDWMQTEVEMVRSLDPKRKVLVSFWANETTKRGVYKEAIRQGDCIGLDIYPRVPTSFPKNIITPYSGPLDSWKKHQAICKQIQSLKKEVWITEIQAEPWEPGVLVADTGPTPSFPPERFQNHLTLASSLNPSVILFWGYEYWYTQKLCGNLSYWNTARSALKEICV